MGGGSKKQVVGFRYYMGLHMGFCHGPIDSVREIKVSDKVAWPLGNDAPFRIDEQTGQWAMPSTLYLLQGRPPGSPIPPEAPAIQQGIVTQSGRVFINAPNLFGGDEKEGGVSGYVNFHLGGPTETRDPYLVKVLGPDVPAYRGVVTAVAEQCFVAAMNPYIKAWSIYGTRIFAQSDGSAQWYPERAALSAGLDMNPIHMIRECFTNQIWGKGLDGLTDIDDSSFRAAADTLKNEDFGLSFLWADTRDVDAFVQTICAHIDGVVYQDRITNKWKVKLGRDDYDPNDLRIFNEDNILSVDELGRPLPSEVVNQVTLTYWSRDNRKNDFIVLDNNALQDAIGGKIIPNDIDRTGICRLDLAQRVAARELRALGSPLLTGKITVNRDGLDVAMAGVFKLNLPSRKIESAICRVTNINYGTLESGGIVISFVEDVFALPLSTYLGSNPTLWEDPRKPPQIALNRYMGEIPYYTLIQALGTQGYASLSPTSGGVAYAGSRQSGATYNMQAWLWQGGAPATNRGSMAAAAVARVPLGGIREETSTLLIDQIIDAPEIYYGTYAVWGTEMVKVLDYLSMTNILVLARGVLDTVPQEHPPGSKIVFIENHQHLDEQPYGPSETVYGKIVTQTATGFLPIADAPVDSVVMNSRHIRPYPPGRFRVDGSLDVVDLFGGNPVLSWTHRNRLQQTAYVVEQGEGNIGPEPGTTYRIRTLRPNGTIAGTYTTTGTDWTYGAAQATADGGLQELTFEVSSVRDGYNSWQAQTHSVVRHGLGFQLGLELGGVTQ